MRSPSLMLPSLFALITIELAGCTSETHPAATSPFLPSSRLRATSSESVIHSFGNGADGANPYASLIDVNGKLYGTTAAGGTAGFGTAFEITMPGQESVLYNFAGYPDAEFTQSPLLSVNGKFYGTSCCGGAHSGGTIFKITRSGRETVIYSFSQTGVLPGPEAGLIDVGGKLYGTEPSGGAYNDGAIFSITKSGTLQVLHSFTGADGAGPAASLLNVHGKLYGTAVGGGSGNRGSVFSVTTAGKFQVIYNFSSLNDDAMNPYAALIDVGGVLYGTTLDGGTHNNGAVFSVTPSGKEKVLHSFAGPPDGAAPLAALVYVGALKKFFGTTSEGGDGSVCIYSYGLGCGTVFAMNAVGSVSILYAFSGSPDGADPNAPLIVIGNSAYGTTLAGGAYNASGCLFQPKGCGTVFKVAL